MRRILSHFGAGLVAAGILVMAARLGLSQSPARSPAPAQDDTIRVNVDLVNLFFTVKTKKGQLIPNLEKQNFRIFEDGKPENIQRFSRETDLPLTLGLLIDISASQERLVDIERQAASQFFSSVVRKKDEAFVISFGKDTELLQDYTNSPQRLTASLEDLRGDGGSPMISRGPIPNVNTGPIGNLPVKGTLLFDAVYLASNEKLKSEVGRKALILITDGEDQGSHYDRRAAIEAAQKSDAIVYSIYYVDQGFYRSMGGYGGGNKGDLSKMSEETGGHVFEVNGKHPLAEIFQQIQDELRNQYSIGYSSMNTRRDGTFRRIEIKTDNNDRKVQARNGYYATPPDAP